MAALDWLAAPVAQASPVAPPGGSALQWCLWRPVVVVVVVVVAAAAAAAVAAAVAAVADD